HVGRVLKLVRGLPWQRILGAGGRISLRGEFAMEQRFLLEAEGVRFRGRRVDLREFEHRFSNRNPKLGAKSPASNSGRTSAVNAKPMHPKW
ncbi:MAG: hypothetical protein ABSG46_12255, partial [Candidatus Binataceae bacterium]